MLYATAGATLKHYIIVMVYYHTINTANKMNNQINGVYWGAFKELALGALNYGWNQMSDEILYWTGN